MATQIGTITALAGNATATSADGIVRNLAVGSVVYLNDVIRTGAAGAVSLTFVDGTTMDLGRDDQATIDSRVIDAAAVAESVADTDADIAAIQQAILEGRDPSEITEAPAAGAGVEGGNEGHDAVFVDYLNPEVTPEAGFDTIGVSRDFSVPEETTIVLEAEEAPVPPPPAPEDLPPQADEVITVAEMGDVPAPLLAALDALASDLGEEDIGLYKLFTVDAVIGDNDLDQADFGGADAETSLENLVFTLQTAPSYGTLVLITEGGDVSLSVRG